MVCRTSAADMDSLQLEIPDIDNDLESYQVHRHGHKIGTAWSAVHALENESFDAPCRVKWELCST